MFYSDLRYCFPFHTRYHLKQLVLILITWPKLVRMLGYKNAPKFPVTLTSNFNGKKAYGNTLNFQLSHQLNGCLDFWGMPYQLINSFCAVKRFLFFFPYLKHYIFLSEGGMYVESKLRFFSCSRFSVSLMG